MKFKILTLLTLLICTTTFASNSLLTTNNTITDSTVKKSIIKDSLKFQGKYSGGIGTEASPLIISTPKDLIQLSKNFYDWNKHFILANDIIFPVDFSKTDWNNDGKIDFSKKDQLGFSPIGNRKIKFKGSLNGNNKTIKNIVILRKYGAYRNVGLFGYVYGAKIYDLTFAGVINAYSNVGAIAGVADSSNFTNILVNAAVYGYMTIGGLVGFSENSNYYNCNNIGIIKGYKNVGGLIGRAKNSLIKKSKNKGYIFSIINGGGIIGDAYKTTLLTSYNSGKVKGSKHHGGLIGKQVYGGIDSSYNKGIVEYSKFAGIFYANDSLFAKGEGLGGLVGTANLSFITHSHNSGAIKARSRSNVGGIVGYMRDVTVSNSYNDGFVNAKVILGGIAGYAYGRYIKGCYNSGKIIGNYKVGGLVGYNDSTEILYSYNNGFINGTIQVKHFTSFKDSEFKALDYGHYKQLMLSGLKGASNQVEIYSSYNADVGQDSTWELGVDSCDANSMWNFSEFGTKYLSWQKASFSNAKIVYKDSSYNFDSLAFINPDNIEVKDFGFRYYAFYDNDWRYSPTVKILDSLNFELNQLKKNEDFSIQIYAIGMDSTYYYGNQILLMKEEPKDHSINDTTTDEANKDFAKDVTQTNQNDGTDYTVIHQAIAIAPELKDITIINPNDKNNILEMIKSLKTLAYQLSTSYNNYLQYDHNFETTIWIKMTISRYGHAKELTIDSTIINHLEFEKEILKKIKNWRCYMGQNQSTTLIVPFKFYNEKKTIQKKDKHKSLPIIKSDRIGAYKIKQNPQKLKEKPKKTKVNSIFTKIFGERINSKNKRPLNSSQPGRKIIYENWKPQSRSRLGGRRRNNQSRINFEQGYGDDKDLGLGWLLTTGSSSKKIKSLVKLPTSKDIEILTQDSKKDILGKIRILRVLRSRTPGLRHIYKKYLKTNKTFEAKIWIKMTIDASGKIIKINVDSTTSKNDAFEKIALKKIKLWKFSEIKAGMTTIRFPLEFVKDGFIKTKEVYVYMDIITTGKLRKLKHNEIKFKSCGTRKKSDIIEEIEKKYKVLSVEYNNLLKNDKLFDGKIILNLTIAPNGKVIDIYSSFSTTEHKIFDTNIIDMVSKWRWKPTENGNSLVTIPLEFYLDSTKTYKRW